MKLDRKLQLEILNACAEFYPSQIPLEPYNKICNSQKDLLGEIESDKKLRANFMYLNEHELIYAPLRKGSIRVEFSEAPRITAKGMDFLADDGGLSAILGVVTIKFHEESIRAIIEAQIAASSLPEAQKESLLKRVKECSVEMIRDGALKLITAGIEHELGKGVEALSHILPAIF